MFDMIQWIDNMLCVQGGWLYGDGGIMSESCYKKLAQRRNINVHQRACRNRPAWVVYESMPERFKEAIESKIGDIYQYVKENELLKYIREDQKALKIFRDYRFGDDRKLPDEAILEYYSNVKVMRPYMRWSGPPSDAPKVGEKDHGERVGGNRRVGETARQAQDPAQSAGKSPAVEGKTLGLPERGA